MWLRELLADFGYFLRAHKLWWITPIAVVLLLIVLLVLLGPSDEQRPFMYQLF